MAEVSIDAMDVGKKITVTVTVKRLKEFNFRLWVALKFVRLAGKISPINFNEKWEDE